ncbi:MAG: Fic family protein [Nitrospinota bacterium]
MPAPLPPSFQWNDALVRALSAADQGLGRLAGVGQTLANPHLLIRPFIRREAVLSSRIENTQASLSDLFLFEAAPSLPPRVPDVREVSNYIVALEYGLHRATELPLSLRLLREMHQRLMEGGRGEQQAPGNFRRTQNWIGPPGCTLEDAAFVPPPPPEMKQALGDFEKYFHTPSPLPPLVRLAMIHYQFEAIHPFLDGNGRIGRLLVTLLLCLEGLLPQPLLYLSAYFERHRQEYYQHLLAVSQAGQWAEWVTFFLSGVTEQARDAVERSDRLLGLREEFHEMLQAARSSALQLKLVDHLFSHPMTTVPLAARLLEVTNRSAQGNINKLIDAGILREVTGRKRNRVFVAEEILRAVEDSRGAADKVNRERSE